MITYTWDILSLTKKDFPELNLTNVVISVEWKKTGVDEEGNEASFIGSTAVPPPADASNFSDLDDLTEDQVVQWIVANLNNMTFVDAKIAQDIIDSKVKIETIPWTKPKSKKAKKKVK